MKLYALQFCEPDRNHALDKYTVKRLPKLIGQLAGFTTSNNGDAEFSVDVTYALCDCNGRIWVTASREVAESAASTNTDWYNAGFETPKNPYVGALRVVELGLVS